MWETAQDQCEYGGSEIHSQDEELKCVKNYSFSFMPSDGSYDVLKADQKTQCRMYALVAASVEKVQVQGSSEDGFAKNLNRYENTRQWPTISLSLWGKECNRAN
jgi:hypothetical protein